MGGEWLGIAIEALMARIFFLRHVVGIGSAANPHAPWKVAVHITVILQHLRAIARPEENRKLIRMAKKRLPHARHFFGQGCDILFPGGSEGFQAQFQLHVLELFHGV